MKFSHALAFLGLVATVSALPIPLRRRQLEVPQQQPINDVDILQFALSLENLEANFYLQGLSKFSEADFRRENIPNPTQTFQNFHHILQHEVQHVKTLQTIITALGGTPVPPCEYQFPFQTVQQFMAVANSLEKVGVSAYNGALAIMQSPDLKTAAATIDTVEARHASFLQTANGGDPFPENFDVALDGRQIITLASPFIKQCSFDLGFVPFGLLQIKNQINLPESDVEVSFLQVTPGGQNFCNWLFAEQSIVVPLDDNLCEIPRGARGDVYLMITNDPTPVTLKKTNTIVAGPAVVTIDTAHSDSCKKLFSGKKLEEGKLNQPVDHGPIPFNDPAAYGTTPLVSDEQPSAVGEVPGVLPTSVGAILTPGTPLPPSDLGAIPTPTSLVGEFPPSSTVPPPTVEGGIPSETTLPGSNVVSAIPTDLPGVPPTVIDVAAQDPSIQEMFAEVAAYVTGVIPTTPVDPLTGLPAQPTTVPVVDPVTGLPVQPPTVPVVDPVTGLPVQPPTVPVVDPVTGLPVQPPTVPVVDPVTGLPVQPPTVPVVDPVTGLPVQPTTVPVVDPVTGLPVQPTTVPVVDPVTGLPTEPTTVPAVDPVTGLPVELTPVVDPVTGLPAEPTMLVGPTTGPPTQTLPPVTVETVSVPPVDPATAPPAYGQLPPAYGQLPSSSLSTLKEGEIPVTEIDINLASNDLVVPFPTPEHPALR